MNIYEEAELEARDLTCYACDRPISVSNYYDYEGYCEDCWNSFEDKSGDFQFFGRNM